MAIFNGKFKSATVEWPTPQGMFDRLNERFKFTLDVCATKENAKCKDFFTKEVDGLSQEWSGVCWMNPPYGRQMIKWLERAAAEKENGITTVALIPARTNTGWWHDIVWRHAIVEFVRGRPKFGDAKHGLPQPLAIAIFQGKQQ